MYRHLTALAAFLTIIQLNGPMSCQAGSFDATSITSGTDYAELVKESGHKGTFNKLIGSYDNTTFSISIGRFDLPGMAYYPEGVHYGASSRYVWISSYYRYFSGIVLVDVVTGKSVFAGTGRAPALSPDNKRVTYAVDGIYGSLIAVAVNDFVVFPRVQQSTEIIGRGNNDVINSARNTPMMSPETYLSWLSNSTLCFVYSENGRPAYLEENPDIQKFYLVEVTGVGDDMSTNTIVVKRAELTTEQRKNLKEDKRWEHWNPRELRDQLADKFIPVTGDLWEPYIFNNHPKWPMLPEPNEPDRNYWDSPDHRHSISAGFDRFYTDSHSGIGIYFDNVKLVTIKNHKEISDAVDSGNLQTTMSKHFVTIGPTSRLLSRPHWITNSKAEVVMQSNWAAEAILDDRSKTKFWLVTMGTDASTTEPVASKKEIPRKIAQELIKKFGTRSASK